MIRIELHTTAHGMRKAGGLFIGLRYHYPGNVLTNSDSGPFFDEWETHDFNIGLLILTLHINFMIKQKGWMIKQDNQPGI